MANGHAHYSITQMHKKHVCAMKLKNYLFSDSGILQWTCVAECQASVVVVRSVLFDRIINVLRVRIDLKRWFSANSRANFTRTGQIKKETPRINRNHCEFLKKINLFAEDYLQKSDSELNSELNIL